MKSCLSLKKDVSTTFATTIVVVVLVLSFRKIPNYLCLGLFKLHNYKLRHAQACTHVLSSPGTLERDKKNGARRR